MQNNKLNYDILEEITKPSSGISIEVTNIDVKRLRDDRSEIFGGQDIAFVATASFRATQNSLQELRKYGGLGEIAVGDELFAIRSDAELNSDVVQLDEDSVALWINDHFTFTFSLNGVDDGPDGPFRDLGCVTIVTDSPEDHEGKLALPWLKKLNTAAVKCDYIDVDVRITGNEPDDPPDELTTTCRLENNTAVAFLRTTVDQSGEIIKEERVELDVFLELGDHEASLVELASNGLRVSLAGAPSDIKLALVPRTQTPGHRPAAPTKPIKQQP